MTDDDDDNKSSNDDEDDDNDCYQNSNNTSIYNDNNNGNIKSHITADYNITKQMKIANDCYTDTDSPDRLQQEQNKKKPTKSDNRFTQNWLRRQ